MDIHLKDLYCTYDIEPYAAPGKVGDKLGDVYEDYSLFIFQNKDYLEAYKQGLKDYNHEDGYQIFLDLMHKLHRFDTFNITHIKTTKKIPPLPSGGNPKTDILITVFFSNTRPILIPMSVKQSTKNEVAFAEFDANTIISGVGITDTVINELLFKHQTDASAKNFTNQEKVELTRRLNLIKEKFVRWVITGTTEKKPTDIKFPKLILKFKLEKGTFDLINYSTCTIKQYINGTLYFPNGNPKKAGFGTGLSWTYASGSKGSKIQFKG